MAVMIPVWPINATYMGPLTLYLYFMYGRPSKLSASDDAAGDGAGAGGGHCHSSIDGHQDHDGSHRGCEDGVRVGAMDDKTGDDEHCKHRSVVLPGDESCGGHHAKHHAAGDDPSHLTQTNMHEHGHHHGDGPMNHASHGNAAHNTSSTTSPSSGDVEKQQHQHQHHNVDHSMMHHHHMGDDRPMWATVFIGVSHCGAGKCIQSL